MAKIITSTALFTPAIGKCYEVHFGKIKVGKKVGYGVARINIQGKHHSQWIDLETGTVIDPAIARNVVKAFEEIDCV